MNFFSIISPISLRSDMINGDSQLREFGRFRLKDRNGVLVGLINRIGLGAAVTIRDRYTLGHGRLLSILFSDGNTLTVRLDQGVSYWRVKQYTPFRATFFDINDEDVEGQVKVLSRLDVDIVGQATPTQIFIKIR